MTMCRMVFIRPPEFRSCSRFSCQSILLRSTWALYNAPNTPAESMEIPISSLILSVGCRLRCVWMMLTRLLKSSYLAPCAQLKHCECTFPSTKIQNLVNNSNFPSFNPLILVKSNNLLFKLSASTTTCPAFFYSLSGCLSRLILKTFLRQSAFASTWTFYTVSFNAFAQLAAYQHGWIKTFRVADTQFDLWQISPDRR